MLPESVGPKWVIEQLLNTSLFQCCGDEDLFPFQCDQCNHPLVLCYECETLYPDLKDLSQRESWGGGDCQCPQCHAQLDDDFFMQNDKNRISTEEWHQHGLNGLLIERTREELAVFLMLMAGELLERLNEGQRLIRPRFQQFRVLAKSVSGCFPESIAQCEELRQNTSSLTLEDAVQQVSQIQKPVNRAYALLGLTDRFPSCIWP